MRLPFLWTDKVIELGGGSCPVASGHWPNVDVRWEKGVDIVADFNYKLPIPDSSYAGVYSRFAIEHISWRKVDLFISEMARILKPGGVAFIITANLLEQSRRLVESNDWNSDLICSIFGDQNYGENSHKTGFSPDYAIKLFKAAGFYKVEVSPLETCATDMVILATKSLAEVTV